MGKLDDEGSPEAVPLTHRRSISLASQTSTDSGLSVASTTFLEAHKAAMVAAADDQGGEAENQGQRYRDIEDGANDGSDEPFLPGRKKTTASSNRMRRVLWALGLLCIGGWLLAFVLFLTSKRPGTAALSSTSTVTIHDPHSATGGTSYGRSVTLEQMLKGEWLPRSHAISWIAGPNGEDGLLVEQGESGDGYLRVEDIRSRKNLPGALETRVLMDKPQVRVDGELVRPSMTWPSPNLEKVLIMSEIGRAHV